MDQDRANRAEPECDHPALIARLEGLMGPDRDVDLAILRYLEPGKWRTSFAWSGNKDIVTEDIEIDDLDIGDFPATKIVPYFTKSTDVALTVVPDFINRRWYIADSDDRSNGKAVAAVYRPSDVFKGRIPRSEGATPAIALCIAALKARTMIARAGEQTQVVA